MAPSALRQEPHKHWVLAPEGRLSEPQKYSLQPVLGLFRTPSWRDKVSESDADNEVSV